MHFYKFKPRNGSCQFLAVLRIFSESLLNEEDEKKKKKLVQSDALIKFAVAYVNIKRGFIEFNGGYSWNKSPLYTYVRCDIMIVDLYK